jgi:simple sugar transport system permease protein
MKLASIAKQLLLGGIALLLLGLVLFFWKRLTKAYGVPRTIITLFFIYLCLLAEVYHISVTMMLGNVLERMTMYGVLVLAMMPGIQCGIGLNMGMTIGCIAGLLGIVLALQWNMIGFVALIVACLLGVVIATPLGWSYSKLLNRMKGNEMTISTYVGFSFVSLMCIGWMLLPFNNPKIIWLLSGRGLRVTHSLLGSFAHLLDNALSFRVFGIKIPTGGLLFLGVCCLMMWLFSRSKTGIAMTAVGSNPRFAEASGISVNRMRTIGTVLSTIIAAVGIVIYSQAFGYAQLYTAPRQLGFIASSAILIGGATVSKAKVSHVLIGVFLFEGVLVFGQQIANSVVAGGGLSEVMRIMISNGIILYALTQTGGGRRE